MAYLLTRMEDDNVTCILCDKVSPNWGWAGLCNRTCYHGLCNLLEAFESGLVSDPDPRLLKYFTLYPNPSHTFIRNKLTKLMNKED
jgi:hypothetical protein